jgi:Protein of unknown function (DUF1064)
MTEVLTRKAFIELQAKKPSKFRSKRVEIDGISFASKREGARWRVLQLLQRGGVISNLRRQVRFPLSVNDSRITAYVADFVYNDINGELVVEDAKGFATDVFRIKAKWMKAEHNITVRTV